MTTFIPNVHIKDGEYTKTIYLMVEYIYILQIIFYQLMFKYNLIIIKNFLNYINIKY